MKQVLQYRRSGRTAVVEVPAPVAPAGGALVRTHWSLISPGTERMLVEAGGANLAVVAARRPDLVKQVVDKARRDGVAATIEAVRGRIDVPVPLGYSCAGEVVEVGPGATGVRAGDRVACAGAGLANHAEFVGVPPRLMVPVPDGVDLADAAFVTVGAIALQGVRIADVRVGETCAVIGLGLVGQLTVQILKAAGCRVFGIDVAADRAALARSLGADDACARGDASLEERVQALTGGRGVDAVLITAATDSSDPVALAARLARDRAVVVAVGLVGMDVPRNAYYEKELQLRLSRSYGPGRYDPTYERDGVDYPLGYVRWTEQRNMEGFLQLVAEGRVEPRRLVTHRIPIAEAERAYAIVRGEVAETSMGILLRYEIDAVPNHRVAVHAVEPPASRASAADGAAPVRLGVVGAGAFARSVLLPALRRLGAERVQPRVVATATGPSARQVAERFGFAAAATDWREVVDDPQVDAVLVATRHDLHATIAAAALRAGKAVFVEKPMAMDDEGVEEVLRAWHEGGQRPLLVGFNRRFAPATAAVKAHVGVTAAPLVLAYRVNAGRAAATSWVLDPSQGGGRLVGEVCHMVDLVQYVAGASVRTVHAQALPGAPSVSDDDVLLTLTLANGSLATIIYAAGGDRGLPKERLEVFGGGRSAVLDDFSEVRLYASGRESKRTWRPQDKGHQAEMDAFLRAVAGGGPSPIAPPDAAHTTRVTLAALQSLAAGVPVALPLG